MSGASGPENYKFKRDTELAEGRRDGDPLYITHRHPDAVQTRRTGRAREETPRIKRRGGSAALLDELKYRSGHSSALGTQRYRRRFADY